MIRNKIYFRLKPFIPLRLRRAIRKEFAQRIREASGGIWPIKESAAFKPPGWPGWPEGKQFALVLTHDVESQAGVDRVRRLAELEIELGVRSSFNFIPEGAYRVSGELRNWLVDNGFEVGVHDLHHDGHLYRSRWQFAKKAERINHYLTEWKASGFRSGFMLKELDWLHDLNIRYDASTFDTDPFEPQPDAVDTIFPFWISGPPRTGGNDQAEAGGYVELPYTLPQDSTLFLLLRESSIDIWTKKTAWVVSKGGMLLLDTHPDYMAMDGPPRHSGEYSVSLYTDFIRHVLASYGGKYWHVLPRQVADCFHLPRPTEAGAAFFIQRSKRKPKIWVDLDNTPHVPFFEPILEELSERGFPLLLTARDAFQVCELADKKGLAYIKVGRHHGKNRAMKAAGLMHRALQLSSVELRERPVLAVSHGARSQLLLSNWRRIPSVLIEDYEHSRFTPMMRPTWIMAPEIIPDDALGDHNGNVRKYPGIKEDVYVWKLVPDDRILQKLELNPTDIIVTVRPPATEAHYHNPETTKLFECFMDRACRTPNIRIVLLPRNQKQGERIRLGWPQWFANDRTVIPSAALDGLNLMWHSDLVVSGGGTMNREAAALGVPVFSIFRGVIGAVDRHLSEQGRLVLVQTQNEVKDNIPLVKRIPKPFGQTTSKRTLYHIVDTIEEIAASYNGA